MINTYYVGKSLNLIWITVVPIQLLFFDDVFSSEWKNLKQEAVDIKPGAGLQELLYNVNDNQNCKFSYKAQGGTKESWDFLIEKHKSKKIWRCIIKRPIGVSYLFFEEFLFELSSGNFKSIHLEKQPDVELPDHEYIVDHDTNTVKHNPGKFNSQLNYVEVQFNNKDKKKSKEL